MSTETPPPAAGPVDPAAGPAGPADPAPGAADPAADPADPTGASPTPPDTTAPDAPLPLAPPADPALARALAAFEHGDFHAARALLPAAPQPTGDDPRHYARLHRALAFEPWLAVMAAAAFAFWIAMFTWAQ